MTREQERQELYKTIWSIANDLRGSVDGWDFKAYVLGMLAYRYLSESLAGELNRGEREAGVADFDYAKQDECLEGQDRLNFVQNRGYYIEPGLLFENVMQADESCLNEKLDAALRQIEASGEGTGAAKMFEGLFTDMDLNSNKLGAGTEERNRQLKKLMASIGSLKLGTCMTDRVGSIGRVGGVGNSVDIFGDAYEYLMTMYAANAGKSGGEYFTPPEVSELLARIVTENGTKKAPRGEWRCYDVAISMPLPPTKCFSGVVVGDVDVNTGGKTVIQYGIKTSVGFGPETQVVERVQAIVDEFGGLDVKF